MRRTILVTVGAAALALAGCGVGAPSPRQPGTEPTTAADPAATSRPGGGLPPNRPLRSARSATVVDGDTIRLDDGRSVRVVGIDTPERGECGSAEASRTAAALIVAGVVLRRAKGENTDHYGRLLRYVTTSRGDLGTIMLRRGLAIARYDSGDGYGWHPLESRYHRIDDRVPQHCATALAPAPTPAPLAAPPVAAAPLAPPPETVFGTGCDPNYGGGCVPPAAADLDCGQLSFAPVLIRASDPHGFDGDGDGVGCESS